MNCSSSSSSSSSMIIRGACVWRSTAQDKFIASAAKKYWIRDGIYGDFSFFKAPLTHGRFPKFHRVVLGRDPGTLKSDIVSKKTSTMHLFGFETLELKIRRLKLCPGLEFEIVVGHTSLFGCIQVNI